MLKKCTTCEQKKPCIFLRHSGLSGKGSRNIYVDDKGEIWKSATCPTCYKNRKSIPNKMKPHRKCRICSKPLDSTRYFNCSTCIEVLDQDPGDFIYSCLDY